MERTSKILWGVILAVVLLYLSLTIVVFSTQNNNKKEVSIEDEMKNRLSLIPLNILYKNPLSVSIVGDRPWIWANTNSTLNGHVLFFKLFVVPFFPCDKKTLSLQGGDYSAVYIDGVFIVDTNSTTNKDMNIPLTPGKHLICIFSSATTADKKAVALTLSNKDFVILKTDVTWKCQLLRSV